MRKVLLGSICFLALPIILFAYSFGPPPGFTGAPGELSCTFCHIGAPLNPGDATLSVIGLPTDYQPGATYPLSATLSDAGHFRWGFQLVVKDTAQLQAGTIVRTDTVNTQIMTSFDGHQYLEQTSTGTFQGSSGPAVWNFSWTAPPQGTGPVTFYAAGNVTNNDLFSSGDSIYTRSFSVPEMTTGVTREEKAGVPSSFTLSQNSPNPFNAATQIVFDLPGGETRPGRLELFNILGQKIKTLIDEPLPGNRYRVEWDGTDEAGRRVASGIYFYRITSDQRQITKRMALLK